MKKKNIVDGVNGIIINKKAGDLMATLTFIEATTNSITVSYNVSFSGFKGTVESKTYSGVLTLSNNTTKELSKTRDTITFDARVNAGKQYTVSGTLTCEYTYSRTVQTDEGPVTQYGNDSIEEEFDSLVVYTHPGEFTMDAKRDDPIYRVLTRDKVVDWIAHFQKAYRWKIQKEKTYNDIINGKTFEEHMGQVEVNNPITAEWFNACMAAMRKIGYTGDKYSHTYTGGPNGDIITAETINLMNISYSG